MNLSISK